MEIPESVRTIRIPQRKKLNGAGAYGRYYRVSKTTGVKCLKDIHVEDRECGAYAWRDAKHELQLQNIAAEAGLSVRAHELVIVDEGEGYQYVGILMDHIRGKRLRMSSGYQPEQRQAIADRLDKRLRAIGIDHDDLHGSNIMRVRKRWVAIDFGRASYSGDRDEPWEE